MAFSEQSLFGDVANGVITVTPPGASKPVYIATPAVATWIELVKEAQAFDNKTPDSPFITKAVAACMVDEAGKPLDDGTLRSALAKSNPTLVMFLYKKCWETVLKVDVREIEQLEGK